MKNSPHYRNNLEIPKAIKMYAYYKSQIERSPHQTLKNKFGNKDTKEKYWDRGINISDNFFPQN